MKDQTLKAAIRWKYLLAVFKLRRMVNRLLATRRLDYAPHALWLSTDTIREYETRARSVRKEPLTVSWIEKNGAPNAVLYDIGANVGAYGLIAASRGMRVFAFEAAHPNIFKLHENIRLNRLEGSMTIVPLMLASGYGIARTEPKNDSFGATHSFSLHRQSPGGHAYLALPLDECVRLFTLPAPCMMKIDVDGAEAEVLAGARETLRDPMLAHVLIETDAHTDRGVRQLMGEAGFEVADEERTGATTNLVFRRASSRGVS